MSDRKIDGGKAQHDSAKPAAFTAQELAWYGEAYERAFIEKLKIDNQLSALAAKLKPKTSILH